MFFPLPRGAAALAPSTIKVVTPVPYLACAPRPIRVASRPHYTAWAQHLHSAFKRVGKSSAIEKRGVPWRQAARRRLPSAPPRLRSEEHTSELQSLMRSSYAVFCLKTKNKQHNRHNTTRKTNTNT